MMIVVQNMGILVAKRGTGFDLDTGPFRYARLSSNRRRNESYISSQRTGYETFLKQMKRK